jgi:hypothetical protein
MILKIEIDVNGQGEAYDVVSRLGLEHAVTKAEFNDEVWEFDSTIKPANFLKPADDTALTYKNKADIDADKPENDPSKNFY